MFKYDYKDLAKFTEDVQFLNKIGGGNNGKKTSAILSACLTKFSVNEDSNIVILILLLILNIIIYACIVLVLYVIYYLVFVGYPKVLVNFFTFSMSNVEDMDKLINANNTFYNLYNDLLDKNPSCGTTSAYDTYNKIYQNDISELKSKFTKLDLNIQDKYSQFNNNNKYLNAFREYYVFYNKIIEDVNSPNPDAKSPLNKVFNTSISDVSSITIRLDGVEKTTVITHNIYYKALVDYKSFYKTLDVQPSPEQTIIKLYTDDKNNSFESYNTHKDIKNIINEISIKISDINKILIDPLKNYIPFIILPTKESDITNVINDYNKFFIKKDILYNPINIDPIKYISFSKKLIYLL